MDGSFLPIKNPLKKKKTDKQQDPTVQHRKLFPVIIHNRKEYEKGYIYK